MWKVENRGVLYHTVGYTSYITMLFVVISFSGVFSICVGTLGIVQIRDFRRSLIRFVSIRCMWGEYKSSPFLLFFFSG